MGVQADGGQGRASGNVLLRQGCGGHVWAGWGQKQSRVGLARMLAVRFSVDKGTLWSEHEVMEAEWQLNDEEEWTVSMVTGQKSGPVSMATPGKKARSFAVWDKLESPCTASA